MGTRVATTLWVVYLRTVYKDPVGRVAVCKQSEWDEMEKAQPGRHTPIRQAIASEAEAEKLARSQPGYEAPSTIRLKPRA